MSNSPTYFLRWKGQQLGPFTPDVIQQKVRDHELSLAHEIQVDGTWRSLRGFLNLQAQTEEQERQQTHLRRMQDELDEKEVVLESTRLELEKTKREQSRFQSMSPAPAGQQVGTPFQVQAAAQSNTSGFAVTGLILGILSLLCFGPVFGILGIIFSAIARSRIRENPTLLKGKGMATAGLTLSIIGTTFWLIWWLFFLGTFTALWAAFAAFWAAAINKIR